MRRISAVGLRQTPAVTPVVGWASILPYVQIAYWWDGSNSIQVLQNDILVPGRTYQLKVTQACSLDYGEYHYSLTAGWNSIVWGTTPTPTPTGFGGLGLIALIVLGIIIFGEK